MVHEAQTREQARNDLIDRWNRDRQASPDNSRIILTHTVDDAHWNAVRARQKDIAVRFEATAEGVRKAKTRKLHEKKRPVSLLSGLLTCGCCGGKYGLIMRDRYGCLNHHRRGTCDNNRTIIRDKIEERVLSGLKDRLISSRAVEETVRAFAEEMNRPNRERRAQGEQDRKVLDKIGKAIAGIIAAIEDGMYQPSMKARMDELERQKDEIVARQLKAPAPTPDVHPNIASIYRKWVERFTDALHNDDRWPYRRRGTAFFYRGSRSHTGRKARRGMPSYAASCSASSTSSRRNTGKGPEKVGQG